MSANMRPASANAIGRLAWAVSTLQSGHADGITMLSFRLSACSVGHGLRGMFHSVAIDAVVLIYMLQLSPNLSL